MYKCVYSRPLITLTNLNIVPIGVISVCLTEASTFNIADFSCPGMNNCIWSQRALVVVRV